MGKYEGEWQIYRTRFLIRARQLTEPLLFRDMLGREHCGQKGDYLVESSDGTRRIAPREIFEDVYVAMGPGDGGLSSLGLGKRRLSKLKPTAASDAPMPRPSVGRGALWKSHRPNRHPTC